MSLSTLRKLLIVQPALTTGALGALICYAIASLSYPTVHSVDFLPLLPGGVLLLVLGALFVYTPVYVLALTLDLRRTLQTAAPGSRIRWGTLALGSQGGYFVIPLLQAYDWGVLDTLVFGVIEFGLISLAAIASVRHIRVGR
ncbi:hypothetical protein C472_00823 [Halorubrum tebenquichense DSM 14210]|uniref:Uncharacterized protein n=1 Tax=Halorubrum tebenquichense DSM 14210 TaxID=1227485 RepID=M0E1J3_9EURY|nr:hypothetical protein C472_00823 [Halorubrum tebenquichense DSM 14210]